jgi:hypothetical protein
LTTLSRPRLCHQQRDRLDARPNGVAWRAARWIALGELALLLGVALLARLAYLDASVHYDELYHILAARAWLTDGSLSITPDGAPYERAWLFTYAVGLCYALLGQAVWVARLPALIAGLALVGAVFAWVRCVAGRAPAWLAGLGLALMPVAIDLSMMSRFYTLQALALWLAGISVYAMVLWRAGWLMQLARGMTLILATTVALHVQPSSLIGLVGIATWAGVTLIVAVMRWDSPEARQQNRRILMVSGFGLALLLFAAWQSGWLAEKWNTYRYATPWAEAQQDAVGYYHQQFVIWYQAFWYLFPAALIVALGRYRYAAGFCAVVFGVGFLAHSFGGMKAERYIFHLLPHFIIIWALALAAIAPTVKRYGLVLARSLGPLQWRPWLSQGFVILLMLGILSFWVYNTPAAHVTMKLVQPGEPATTPYTKSRWDNVAPQLRDLVRASDVVLTTSPAKAIYYLDHNPVGLSTTMLEDGEEFARRVRTGRPAISQRASLRRLMRQHETGLILADIRRWRKSWGVPKDTAEFIETHMQRVALPQESGVLAFRWQRRAGDALPMRAQTPTTQPDTPTAQPPATRETSTAAATDDGP